jgi:SAM-dependent methyltransferase
MSLLQYQRPEGTSTYDGQSFSRAVPLVPSKTMPWQRKAAIARLCAALPFGGRAYQFLQRKFGRLTSDPSLRLPTAAKFARWVFDAGGSVEGANVLEVGTGHKPIVAIGLALLGAKTVHTMDLHRRLDIEIVRGSLRWMVQNREIIHDLYADLTGPRALEHRLDVLTRHIDDPLKCLQALNIDYRAPADAVSSGLPPKSIDIHLSVTTFEHIPTVGIAGIMAEARRVLRTSGVAVHFIDPSDHFAQTDDTIPLIHFLRYSPQEWERIANNDFTYCNRLRRSELARLLGHLGFLIEREEVVVDSRSVEEIAAGFPLHSSYLGMDPADLSTIEMNVLLRRGSLH